jgi:hypothetical protein
VLVRVELGADDEPVGDGRAGQQLGDDPQEQMIMLPPAAAVLGVAPAAPRG